MVPSSSPRIIVAADNTPATTNRKANKRNAFEIMMESAKSPSVFEIDPLIKRRKEDRRSYEDLMKLETPPEAFTIAIKERGRILKEVLKVEIGKDRGRLMNVCINCIPDEMDFIDGVILVIILSKIGIVDLKDKNLRIDFKDHSYWDAMTWSYVINDDNGRITELVVGGHLYGGDGDIATYDTPRCIVHLERLQDLCVIGNCRSLPIKELSKLAHLNALRIVRCLYLLNNFPVQMNIRNLKTLDVRCELSGASFLKWMARHLQFLETLSLSELKGNKMDAFLNFLRTLGPSFQSSLKILNIIDCKVNDGHLETLFF